MKNTLVDLQNHLFEMIKDGITMNFGSEDYRKKSEEKKKMAKKKDKPPKEKLYIYRKCATCGIKLHVTAFYCRICKNKVNYNANTKQLVEDMTYGSKNPEDAIYNHRLNDTDLCITCHNTQIGKTCTYTHCFRTGRGNCEMCDRFEGNRFMCCQNLQKQDRSVRT